MNSKGATFRMKQIHPRNHATEKQAIMHSVTSKVKRNVQTSYRNFQCERNTYTGTVSVEAS